MFEELFTENYSTFCKDKPTDSRHGENLKQDQPKEMCANTHHSQMSENNSHSLRSREREAPSYLRGWVTLEKVTLKSEYLSAYVKGPEKKSTMNSMQAGIDIKRKEQKTERLDKNQ